jgi:LAO/AO transport system kinase
MVKRFPAAQYIRGILEGDRMLLSRAITLVESALPSDQNLAEEVIAGILPFSGNSIRVGITGVPGVGKSTFIESLGMQLVEEGHKLAVLAIDPSSQKTYGSILGDKTRMSSLAADSRAFIRPSPAGQTLGGVSARTREVMLLCEAAGYDVVLVETVGVGQSEISVKGMVDFFLLLMLAGAGDELQGIKKGIIEMCDALVINKADGQNINAAKKAQSEYANALHYLPLQENTWVPQVKTCSGISGEGIMEIWQMILSFKEKMVLNNTWEQNRAQQRVSWLHEHIRYLLEQTFYHHPQVSQKIQEVTAEVKDGKASPIAKARELLKLFKSGN